MDCTLGQIFPRNVLLRSEECCRIITGVITLSSKNKNHKEVYLLWFNFVFGWKSSFFRQTSLNFENWFNFFRTLSIFDIFRYLSVTNFMGYV